MHCSVYIFSDVFASFGGLLMGLKGDIRHLQSFEVDKRIYLLIRKISY